MAYYYQQAVELLFTPDAAKEDLIDALSDVSSEYGYIYCTARHELRQNTAPELTKFTLVIEALKFKIKNYKD
ncbi:hypothetical protein [Microcoleus sp. D2_18a_B4]|uniref:hypothetical protein n=1 Tax=Microcoleus sp. D2_18a_B4 TaxID=3055329 RepID=UPI002FD4A503